jgi:hypothetical protein
MPNCAAAHLCIATGLDVSSKHVCPACCKHVHGICGQNLEDASIQYHTTCFLCFQKYGRAFLDPTSFHDFRNESGINPGRVASPAPMISPTAGDGSTATVIPSVTADATVDCIVESTAADKPENDKRRQWVEKMTLKDCEVGPQNNYGVCELVSIGGMEVKKWRNAELISFCIKNKVTGYKSKSKTHICELIVAKIISQSQFNTIGRLGMTDNELNPEEGEKKVLQRQSTRVKMFDRRL